MTLRDKATGRVLSLTDLTQGRHGTTLLDEKGDEYTVKMVHQKKGKVTVTLLDQLKRDVEVQL